MQCTYNQYDQMEELLKSMFFDAQDYVPSQQNLESEIIPNIDEYLIFLLWIDLTGYETKDNESMRKQIHHLLCEQLELVDDMDVPAESLDSESTCTVTRKAGKKRGKL